MRTAQPLLDGGGKRYARAVRVRSRGGAPLSARTPLLACSLSLALVSRALVCSVCVILIVCSSVHPRVSNSNSTTAHTDRRCFTVDFEFEVMKPGSYCCCLLLLCVPGTYSYYFCSPDLQQLVLLRTGSGMTSVVNFA